MENIKRNVNTMNNKNECPLKIYFKIAEKEVGHRKAN